MCPYRACGWVVNRSGADALIGCAAKKYPALVSVYGGPEFTSNSSRETFVTPSALAELGFLILHVDSRGVPGMGKRTLRVHS